MSRRSCVSRTNPSKAKQADIFSAIPHDLLMPRRGVPREMSLPSHAWRFKNGKQGKWLSRVADTLEADRMGGPRRLADDPSDRSLSVDSGRFRRGGDPVSASGWDIGDCRR